MRCALGVFSGGVSQLRQQIARSPRGRPAQCTSRRRWHRRGCGGRQADFGDHAQQQHWLLHACQVLTGNFF